VGTLVERTTRFLLLVLVPTHKAVFAASAFAGALNTSPAPLRQMLTCDQGKERARHKDLAHATGMRVFFADPHAPWQRGSNENTNGLLRQDFPKGMSLASLTQAHLDTVAENRNTRPRKTLGYDTPHERFTRLLAHLPSSNTPDPDVRSKG
jgi:IS30 family transposase